MSSQKYNKFQAKTTPEVQWKKGHFAVIIDAAAAIIDESKQ